MQKAEKADLVGKYVGRMLEDMDNKTMEAIVADILIDEKLEMDSDELVAEIAEYYPDLVDIKEDE